MSDVVTTTNSIMMVSSSTFGSSSYNNVDKKTESSNAVMRITSLSTQAEISNESECRKRLLHLSIKVYILYICNTTNSVPRMLLKI